MFRPQFDKCGHSVFGAASQFINLADEQMGIRHTRAGRALCNRGVGVDERLIEQLGVELCTRYPNGLYSWIDGAQRGGW